MENSKAARRGCAATHQHPKSSQSPRTSRGHGNIPSRTASTATATATSDPGPSKTLRKDRAKRYSPYPAPHKKTPARGKVPKTPRENCAKYSAPYTRPQEKTPTRNKASEHRVGGRSGRLKDGAPSTIEAELEEEEEGGYDGDDEDGWNFMEGDSSSMRRRIKRFCWGGRVFLGRKLDRVGKFLNEY